MIYKNGKEKIAHTYLEYIFWTKSHVKWTSQNKIFINNNNNFTIVCTTPPPLPPSAGVASYQIFKKESGWPFSGGWGGGGVNKLKYEKFNDKKVQEKCFALS